MNLPFFKSKPRTPLREYLYALEINHGAVKSAVWTIANGKPQVISTGIVATWNDEDESELISACDQTISDCSNKFDPTGKIQPEKVILGLPSDWVSSEKIASVHLKQLKHVSEKLSLTAVGFVVIPEAVTRFLQSQEGAPPTAILVGVTNHQLEVTLVKMGKIIGTHQVVRSAQISSDLIEGLSRFTTGDMLPSRMMLYGLVDHLEEIRQALLAHPWQAPQTKLAFLHFPKVEILSADFSINAISLAGGSEVAVAIGMTTGQETDGEMKTFEQTPSAPFSTSIIPEVSSLEELGFSSADIAPETEIVTSNQSETPLIQNYESEEDESISEAEIISPKKDRRLPHFKLPQFGAKTPILVALAFIIVFLVLGVAYWYLPKATVTLTLEPKNLSDQFEVISDTTLSSPNPDKPAIPANSKEISVQESATIPATGTKLIGDKATGTLTLINGTPVVKKFPAGTILTSSNNLKFLLDSEISVASASGSADPNSYQPGKAEVKVTASTIGSDSNLTAGSQFKVGSFSSLDFVAKNDTAFTGGSSRQVKAVSKDDYAKLRSQLTESAKEKAKAQFLQEINDTQIVVNESIRLSVVSEDFDHKIDETADEVTLKLTVKSTGIILNQNDIASLVSAKLQPQLTSGYQSVGAPTYDIGVKSVDKNQVTITVSSKMSALPQIDEDVLRASLTGKGSQPAFDYLQSLPGVAQVDISYWPPLPSAIRTLPRVSKNINFVIVSK